MCIYILTYMYLCREKNDNVGWTYSWIIAQFVDFVDFVALAFAEIVYVLFMQYHGHTQMCMYM